MGTPRSAGAWAPPTLTLALVPPAPKPAVAVSLLGGSLGSAPTNCVFPGWPPRSGPWGCFPPVAALRLRFSKSYSGGCSVDSGRMALSLIPGPPLSAPWVPALPALEVLGPTHSAMLGPLLATVELSPCPWREPDFAFDRHSDRCERRSLNAHVPSLKSAACGLLMLHLP